MPKEKHSTTNLLFYGLLALLCWLPLPFGSNRPWAEAIIFIYLGALTTLTVVSIARQRTRLPRALICAKYMHACFAGLLLWQLLQYLFIENLRLSAWQHGLLLTLSYWLLFCLTLILTNSARRTQLLLWTLVASGLFQACYGTLMTLSGLEWGFAGVKTSGHGLATGTFVNRNHLAGYLEMTLACGLGLLIGQLKDIHFNSHKERLQHYLQTLLSSKIILRVALGAMVIGLIMTRSRMGNTAFFSSLLISGLLYMWIRQRFTRSALILFASLILIDTLIVSQWFGLEKLAQRLDTTLSHVEVARTTDTTTGKTQIDSEYLLIKTGDTRDEAWREALPMTTDAGIMGRGFDSFPQLFPQYRDGSTQGYFNHAHNDSIELINDFGWLGYILFVSLALQALVISIQAQRQRKESLAISTGFAAMMGIIAITLHTWTEFNLYIPANAATFCILLAMAATAKWGSFKRERSRSK